eukprot:4312474-Amphidinium_carterae.1
MVVPSHCSFPAYFKMRSLGAPPFHPSTSQPLSIRNSKVSRIIARSHKHAVRNAMTWGDPLQDSASPRLSRSARTSRRRTRSVLKIRSRSPQQHADMSDSMT